MILATITIYVAIGTFNFHLWNIFLEKIYEPTEAILMILLWPILILGGLVAFLYNLVDKYLKWLNKERG